MLHGAKAVRGGSRVYLKQHNRLRRNTALNKVYLDGISPMNVKVSRDGDKIYATWVVVTNDSWIDKRTGEKVNHSTYHNCYAIGRVAELAEDMVRTGRNILVEGHIEVSKTPDKTVFTSIRTTYLKVTEKVSRGAPEDRVRGNEYESQIAFAKAQIDD
jgi:single-strand DNA-binding protein